jgi:WD40 repeat protein/predicted Ser/Thr protein kinase
MAVTICCPNPRCGKAHSVAEANLGHAVRCSRCGKKFLAPRSDHESLSAGQTRPADPKRDSYPVSVGVAPPDGDPEPPPAIGRFQVRQRLGAGGFGTVYRAYDPQLEREVALKLPRARTLGDPRRAGRFLDEAKAAARLRHPHIVPVYDAGQEDGRPYIAYAFVKGRTLEQAAAGGTDLRRAAALVRDLAEALAYAHGQGIVHRDVKPANVLLDEAGEPHLADFGTHGVLGTPAYMAPEQAHGGPPQPASDQYSLGVVLYELLCGQRPFAGEHPLALPYHLANREPDPPSDLRPEVPPDLDAVCLKALATAPADRYPTCQEFADDLRRWLEGEPVRARHAGAGERLVRWCRREPRLALAAVAVALCLLAIALVSTVSARREASARRAAELLEAEAIQAKAREADERRQAEQEKEKARQSAKDAQAAEETAKKARDAAEEAGAKWQGEVRAKEGALADLRKATGELRQTLYYRLTTGAERELRDNNVGRARQLLDRCGLDDLAGLRGWEWYHLDRVCDRRLEAATDQGSPSNRLAFSREREGIRLALALRGKRVSLWDLSADRPYTFPEVAHTDDVCCVAWSPDSKWIASGGLDGRVVIWNVETRRSVLKLEGKHVAPVRCVAFNASGTCIASGGDDRKVVVWDAQGGQPLQTFADHPAPIRTVEFSPASGFFDPRTPQHLPPLLCAACQGNEVRIWDLVTEKLLQKPPGKLSGYSVATASPDGQRLALVKENGAISTQRFGDKEVSLSEGQAGEVLHATYSSNGMHFAYLAGRSVRILDTTTGALKFEQPGVLGFAFSVKGPRVATIEEDGTLRVWYIRDGERRSKISPFRADPAAPRGDMVVTHAGYRGHVLGTAFSPDGQFLATASAIEQQGGAKGEVKFWDAATGAELSTFNDHAAEVFCVAFNRDGKRWASCSADGTIHLHEVAGGRVLSLNGHTGEVWFVAYSPDGTWLASGGKDGTVRFWDAATGKAVGQPIQCPGGVSWLAFHPDGEHLAVASAGDPVVKIWRVKPGVDFQAEIVSKLGGGGQGHTQTVTSVAFNKDGTRLASASEDQTVRIWEVETGNELHVLRGHARAVVGVAFHPDGTRLASASHDQTVRLWDTVTGQEALSLKGDTRFNYSIAFSPDGHRLAAGSVDGVKVWYAPHNVR